MAEIAPSLSLGPLQNRLGGTVTIIWTMNVPTGLARNVDIMWKITVPTVWDGEFAHRVIG
jgi:hypothetical protein